MSSDSIQSSRTVLRQYDLSLSEASFAAIDTIESQPGWTLKPMFAPRGKLPQVFVYKVMEKMFAILSVRGDEGIILKAEPDEVLLLRDQYEGVGHRSHLDSRFWISVSMNSDVPPTEVARLIADSYQLVCSKLTKAAKAKLAEQTG